MMKKILAMLLTVLLTLSLLALPAAAVSFSDVPAGCWYEEAVYWAVENNITAGVGNGKFGPNLELTRGQVVTMIWSIQGKPNPSGSSPFSDVPTGLWYSNAVIWAAEKGIVAGLPGGVFKPNQNITRQDLVAILYRYAKFKYGSVSAPSNALQGYSDASKVASYAREGMCWAVANRIVSGTSATTLSPLGTASRCQLVQMLYSWLKDDDWTLPFIPKP